MAIKHLSATNFAERFIAQCIHTALVIFLFCVGTQVCLFSQTSSVPAAFEPQEYEDTAKVLQRIQQHSFGFGFGIITGDASAGREVMMLATRYALKTSSVSEIEFGLHYQSTALALSNAFNFRFTFVSWNGDVSLHMFPFPSWQTFRIGAGLSIRRQIGSYTVTQTSILPTGMTQTVRLTEYQQSLSVGAVCKLDYILFTNAQIEMAARGQAYLYGMPISGENNQVPRGTAGGAVSLGLYIRAFF